MGRKKEYNREELLEKSVQIFRSKGYHATGTDELALEFGINKKSLYAEFGSKLNLFEACLEHYESTFLSLMLSPLEDQASNLDSIKKVFQMIVKYGEREMRGQGCLLCNTSAQRGSLDPSIGSFIDRYFERIEKGFYRALLNSGISGGNTKKEYLKQISSFLTTTLVGIATSIRGEAPVSQLRQTLKFIVEYLNALSEKK